MTPEGVVGRGWIPTADPWLPPSPSVSLYTCLGWLWWTHTLVWADPSGLRKNGEEFGEPALPDTDSTMAFIFRVSSSVSRWMDCRWNLCRVSWLECARWPRVGDWVNLADPVDVGSNCCGGTGGGGGGGGFFWTGACAGVNSMSTTGGGPMLISRPTMLDGVGNMGSAVSSSQVNSKMFLMPLGTEMPAFRQLMSSLEMRASSLGAEAVYCWYNSRLLLMSVMLVQCASC